MLIKMLSTQSGSINGRDVERYDVGQVINLPHSLADVFVDVGWAEEIIEEVPGESRETKPVTGPSKTKPAKPSKRKKRA